MREWLFVNPAYRAALESAGLGSFDAWMTVAREAERSSDRGESLTIVEVAGPPAFRVYLKRFRSTGGSLRRAFGNSRVRREALNLLYLRVIGVPTAEVVAAGEQRGGWFLRRGLTRGEGENSCLVASFMATREIPLARPLTEFAAEFPADVRGRVRREKVALIEKLARVVRRMHDADYAAHDLYARNVLVTAGPDRTHAFWLIDHPRGGRRFLFRRRAQARDLACLRRDLPRSVTRTDLARFVKFYRGVSRLDRRAAALMRSVEKRKRTSVSR